MRRDGNEVKRKKREDPEARVDLESDSFSFFFFLFFFETLHLARCEGVRRDVKTDV